MSERTFYASAGPESRLFGLHLPRRASALPCAAHAPWRPWRLFPFSSRQMVDLSLPVSPAM